MSNTSTRPSYTSLSLPPYTIPWNNAEDKFLKYVLYDKKKGYYENKIPFGYKGDYITSPTISVLFSEMIASRALLEQNKKTMKMIKRSN